MRGAWPCREAVRTLNRVTVACSYLSFRSISYRPSVRLFLSHAATDLAVAKALRLRLEEVPDVQCFVLADDLAPGNDWEVQIRRAASECEAIACLVTPEYMDRPWFYAEWAAFWFQEKTWFLLMYRTSLDDVFEVMRRRHVAFLDDRRSVEKLFAELAEGRQPARGFDLLAAETVRSVADADARQARARLEDNLTRLGVLMRQGESNVSEDVLDALLGSGQLDAIVRIARQTSSDGPVKRRQLATLLVARGHAATAAQFDDLIANHAERRTVGWACLARVQGSPDDAAARQLLEKIYQAIRDPQRRDLRQRAEELGLRIAWPDD